MTPLPLLSTVRDNPRPRLTRSSSPGRLSPLARLWPTN